MLIKILFFYSNNLSLNICINNSIERTLMKAKIFFFTQSIKTFSISHKTDFCYQRYLIVILKLFLYLFTVFSHKVAMKMFSISYKNQSVLLYTV